MGKKTLYRHVHQFLFVLLTIRLLLPPGICVCQWHSPAARMLVHFFGGTKEVPPPPPVENEDDHEPGCPASKLAAGMGLRPASPPALTLDTSVEELPALAASAVRRGRAFINEPRQRDPAIAVRADYALLI